MILSGTIHIDSFNIYIHIIVPCRLVNNLERKNENFQEIGVLQQQLPPPESKELVYGYCSLHLYLYEHFLTER